MAQDLANPNQVRSGGPGGMFQQDVGGGFIPGTVHVDVTKSLNPNLSTAVNNQVGVANQSQSDIAARTMQGTNKQNQLATPETTQQQSGTLGGNSDPGMQAAIANRQSKMFSSDINQLQQNANLGAVGQQMKQQSAGMQAEAALEQQKQQLINAQMVKYQNDQAQRNQVLSSILSIGGMALGAVAGAVGGPGAAKAVGSATSALSGAIGNTKQQQEDTGMGGGF